MSAAPIREPWTTERGISLNCQTLSIYCALNFVTWTANKYLPAILWQFRHLRLWLTDLPGKLTLFEAAFRQKLCINFLRVAFCPPRFCIFGQAEERRRSMSLSSLDAPTPRQLLPTSKLHQTWQQLQEAMTK